MTRGPIWGNRNRTKTSQNLKSSSELTYRMYKPGADPEGGAPGACPPPPLKLEKI